MRVSRAQPSSLAVSGALQAGFVDGTLGRVMSTWEERTLGLMAACDRLGKEIATLLLAPAMRCYLPIHRYCEAAEQIKKLSLVNVDGVFI